MRSVLAARSAAVAACGHEESELCSRQIRAHAAVGDPLSAGVNEMKLSPSPDVSALQSIDDT
jgi:hypothetical protein